VRKGFAAIHVETNKSSLKSLIDDEVVGLNRVDRAKVSIPVKVELIDEKLGRSAGFDLFLEQDGDSSIYSVLALLDLR
jgi:hypothetical protein